MKAYEQRAKLRDASTVKSWLFQIAYRCFLDDYRKSARRRDLVETITEEQAPEADPGLTADVTLAMNSLKPECRAVVILCLAHGLTHAETAHITKLPLGTVKSHVSRGKTKLQAFLHAYEARQ
jgi:RNA polymerase sigma-70 factor (ECF subfamily)